MKKIIAVIILFFFSSSLVSAVLQDPIDAADFLANKGIIQSPNPNNEMLGILKNEFYRLESPISRQEVMKIIGNLSNDTIVDQCSWVFSDVTSGWGCKYIEWALGKEYIAKNPTFRPEDNITKTEAIKLVFKVKQVIKSQNTSNWQEDYMETAYKYKIIDNKYTDYNTDATRGWIFQIVTSMLEQEVEIFEAGWLISDEATLDLIIWDEDKTPSDIWNSYTGTYIDPGDSSITEWEY